MFDPVQFLNVLILTLLCVLLFSEVKPPVLERAANLAYHVLFHCLLRYVC